MSASGRLLVASLLLAGCRARPVCADNIPDTDPWRVQSDAELSASLASASSCALRTHRRVLLEFGASWCPDCRQMRALDATPEAAAALRERYARVRVNLEDWHAMAALRARWRIERIATFVVLDPASGAELARTTLEPVTGGTRIDAAGWARWLRAPSH